MARVDTARSNLHQRLIVALFEVKDDEWLKAYIYGLTNERWVQAHKLRFLFRDMKRMI